jgi:hypothetical protein
MTKWQRTRNWELLVDPNLFCLSESSCLPENRKSLKSSLHLNAAAQELC